MYSNGLYVEKGDIVIEGRKHSCDIRIVEDANEDGILLVNGIKDLFYEYDEFDFFNERFELMVKNEDRMDTYVYKEDYR